MKNRRLLAAVALACIAMAACTRLPVPTAAPPVQPTTPPVTTPQQVIVAVVANLKPTLTPALTQIPTTAPTASTTPAATLVVNVTASPTETPGGPHEEEPKETPVPPPVVSFLEQRITNLFDLARLPLLEGSLATQFSSRNWTSLEHYFDYFIDDGNFEGPNYGYIDENGRRQSYRIVTGYDGKPEYEIVPRTPGPGTIDRIWFAYQQHQSVNNPKDMSQVEEWNVWGNLSGMGNIRFYFDDEPTPRIDFTIKNLFVGINPFRDPISGFYASANGGNITYVPIPFERSVRVTSTGRPRLMQVEIKQQKIASTAIPVSTQPREQPISPIRSFSVDLTPSEQRALDQAVQAWQTCTPALPSNAQSFSLDIPHNESAAVDFQSPATMQGLRVRIPRGMEDSVWMQVFWDGDTEPSLVAPLRGMFGTAERFLPYRSLPLGLDVENGELVLYNNFPMPFQSARIVFMNGRAETLPLRLEVALRETIPGAEKMRLHSFYGTRRMQRREDEGDDYVVIDVHGTGKYLGTIFSAWDLDRGALNGPLDEHWRFPYLESNMDIWVDNRLALPGTGIEDDFNASYYYVYAGYEGYKTTYCLAGLTLLDYGSSKEPSSQYRFYLNDAPEFRDHLRVTAQHGNKGNNLSVTYSSTAFWYLER